MTTFATDPSRLVDTFARSVDGITGFAEDGDVDLPPEGAQLLDGGGALEVGADEQRVAALLLEPAGELAGVRRLTGALEARHQHDRRWAATRT